MIVRIKGMNRGSHSYTFKACRDITLTTAEESMKVAIEVFVPLHPTSGL